MSGNTRLRCGSWAETVVDRAVASVVWTEEKLDRIVLVRRSDSFVATVDIPAEIRRDLRSLDREAVARNARTLSLAVLWALPDMAFASVEGLGRAPLRDGASPAEFGGIRHFAPRMIGVDIGEFELVNRRQSH